MNYGYIRVSTDGQNTENQRFEIESFAERNHIKIDSWIEETVSSRQELRKRKLGKLINRTKAGDLIVASELSRLGRNLLQVMSILNHLLGTETRVWTIKDGYRLGDDISSKVLAFAFGLSAEIERNMIAQRTKEALARIKSEGKPLGRPVGLRNSEHKLGGKLGEIRKLLSRGHSHLSVARKLNVHRNTLGAFLKTKAKTKK